MTQLVTLRLMEYLGVITIAQLQRALVEIFNNDLQTQMEITSGYWYKKLHGQQFSRECKLQRLYKIMPVAKSILNHQIFTILAYRQRLKAKWVISESKIADTTIFNCHASLDWKYSTWFEPSSKCAWHAFEELVALSDSDSLDNLAWFLLARRGITTSQAGMLNEFFILRLYRNIVKNIDQIKHRKFIEERLHFHLN